MLKRVAAAIITLSFLLACYAAYVRAFGQLSLAELDRDFLPPSEDGAPVPDEPQKPNPANIWARKVFGPESWQAKADIALYWSNSGVIIYIADYEQIGAETLKLKPFSLIYMDRSSSRDGEPNIITLRADEATLEFDQPIDILQMSDARPIGGRITGDVEVEADRATPDRADDLLAYTDYLEFQESEHKVWTAAPVRIVTGDTVLTGRGGELQLKDPQPGKKAKSSSAFEGISELVLLHEVQINMKSAGGALIPGAPRPGRYPAGEREAKQVPVSIVCRGPFSYDLAASIAVFHDAVQMTRQTSETEFDRLFCDELHAVFDKQKQAGDGTPDKAGAGKDPSFREAHATGQPVRIVSDSQGMEASGTELHYDAASGQSLLRGVPEVVAAQHGSVIHAPELRLTSGADGQQTAMASGPGHMTMQDKDTGDTSLAAQWQEWVRIEPQGDQQLLVLKGSVTVEQPGRGVLHADRVRVWFARRAGPAPAPALAGGTAMDTSNHVPSRIEATGNVTTTSDQFDIQAIDRLEIAFEDGPIAPPAARPGRTPDERPAPETASAAPPAAPPRRLAPPRTRDDAALSDPTPLSEPTDAAAPATATAADAPADAKPAHPQGHLVAGVVRVRALRDGDRTELAELWAEQNVQMTQPPDTPEGRDKVVRGDNLHVKRLENGNELTVTGTPAHVEMQDMTIEGGTVGVNQPLGIAWVDGKGLMVLPADTAFDGSKLNAPSELNITWVHAMFFDGIKAEFVGAVVASQGPNVVHCDQLEATLSERIDISKPDRHGTKAQIAKVKCTGRAEVDTHSTGEDGSDKFEHLEAKQLDFNNSDGRMLAAGPGLFRTYARGQGGLGPAAPGSPPNAPPKNPDQLYLTEIHFLDQMEANRAQQVATFRGRVKVVRGPVDNEQARVDPNKLPPDGMTMACEQLQMGARNGPNGKSYNELEGSGNVDVEGGRTYYGRADRIVYNQLNDRLIFSSDHGATATLWRQTQPGSRPDEVHGQKIFYRPQTNDVRVEGGTMADFQEREVDKKNRQSGVLRK